MQVEAARTNFMIITAMGSAMFLLGFLLYFNASLVAPYMRYIFTIPPIAVAAYIYVLNLINHMANQKIPMTIEIIVKDLLIEIIIGTGSFILITVLIMFQVYVIAILSRK